MEWRRKDANVLEKCWILLADLYITAGKSDLASELLKKVTEVDQRSVRAWEYLGYINEREQKYAVAAEQYERCWRLGGCMDAAIGFKLGFSYMKAKRFMDAIDVANCVLTKFPDYPKIKTEILDRSRFALRFP